MYYGKGLDYVGASSIHPIRSPKDQFMATYEMMSTRKYSIQALTSSLVGYFPCFFLLFLLFRADSLFSWLFVIKSTDAQGNISPADIRGSPAATSKGDRRAGLLLLGRNGRERFKGHAHLALPYNRYANDDHLRSERGVGCTRNGGNDTQGCKQYALVGE